MSQTINTNIASLNAQYNLDRSQGALQTSLQRLSSGLRINSAKDDAAGLAISDRFTTQIRGLGQAIRNANDGISLAQTGEGALGEVTNNLQRIRELAVQSANATNSASDRAAINLEVQQRLAEIDRSASQTSFNGRKILDGSFGSATFQIGANAGETIGLALSTSMRTNSIGAIATATSVDLSPAFTGTPGTTGSPATYTFDAAALIGDYSITPATFTFGDPDGTASVTVTLNSNITTTTDLLNAITGDLEYDAGTKFSAALSGNNVVLTDNANTAGSFSVSGADASLITSNQISTTAGVADTAPVAATNVTVAGDFSIQIGTSAAVNVANGTYTSAQSLTDAINTALAGNASASVDTTTGRITINSAEDVTVAGTTGLTTLGFSATNVASGSLSGANVLDVNAANTVIQRVDSALTNVINLRGTFGAIQNRFDSVITSLSATTENATAARSRIQDADFAAETAALTRGQILQQAGIAMLSQANQLPQAVLALLR